MSVRQALLIMIAISSSSACLAQEDIDPRILDAGSYNSKGPGPKTYWLEQDLHDGKVVAALKVTQDGFAHLVNRDASSIMAQNWPNFLTFSAESAKQAWGNPSHQSKTRETFDLYNHAGERFSIELSFTKAKLRKYRVHGPGVKESWVSIQE